MSATQPGDREVALGLVDALRPALAAGASVLAVVAARDVARMMGLAGLDAALGELERHADAARPVDVDHLSARIGRIADEAAADGDLRAFHYADRELATLAAQLAATEWCPPSGTGARTVATLAVDEALAGLPLEAAPEALRGRVSMTVASALRAAIDWIGADASPRIAADVHDSALTLTCSGTHDGGVGPAGAVLAAVDGSLGRETDGRWTIRVALATERGSFLLLRQGRYGIALPWHAVARLRMFAPYELERLEEPRLAPLSTGGDSSVERPAALVALGLARAWFVADRIVWRISARAEESDVTGPFVASTRIVEVESGERYWVLDPAWLLRGVVPPDAPPPSPRPRSNVTTLEALPAPAAPAARAPEARPASDSLADAVERALAHLRHERASVPPAAAPAPAHAPAPEPEPLHAESSEWSGVEAVDSLMFTATVDVLLPESALAAAAEAAAATLAPEQLMEDAAPIAEAPAIAEAVEPAPAAETAAPEAIVPEPIVASDVAAPASPIAARVAEAPAAPASEPAPPIAAAPAPAQAAAAAPSGLAGRVFRTPAPAATPAAPPAASPERQPAKRALVADDSLVARIFLARLLEQRGWIVETVADAASLWSELQRGPWDLVLADFALPDAQGPKHVARLLEFVGASEAPAPFIVLTRDADDERAAREVGATKLLRKPFEPIRLDPLLPR